MHVGENFLSIHQMTRYHKHVFKAEICERIFFLCFVQFKLSHDTSSRVCILKMFTFSITNSNLISHYTLLCKVKIDKFLRR